MNLAVVTLGLGLAVQQVIFANPYFTGGFGSVTEIGRIEVFGWDVSSAEHPERYFVVCLAVFVVSLADGREPAPSGSGRRLIAVRNNERAAASLGISVFGAKLYAFAVGAAIAAFAGILLAFKDTTVVYSRYRAPSNRSPRSATRSPEASAGCWARCSAPSSPRAASARSSSTWIDLGDVAHHDRWHRPHRHPVLNPNGIASVVLNDERGTSQSSARALRRKPRREELGDARDAAQCHRDRSRSTT